MPESFTCYRASVCAPCQPRSYVLAHPPPHTHTLSHVYTHYTQFYKGGAKVLEITGGRRDELTAACAKYSAAAAAPWPIEDDGFTSSLGVWPPMPEKKAAAKKAAAKKPAAPKKPAAKKAPAKKAPAAKKVATKKAAAKKAAAPKAAPAKRASAAKKGRAAAAVA